MAPDSFSEVTSQGWLSRLGASIKGVLFGLVLLVVSVGLLWWNEGRAVKTAKSLTEGAAAVVSVPADPVDPSKDGKLVHTSGRAEVSGTLTDPLFGVSSPAIKLRRTVEMYQWDEDEDKETRKKTGGGTETVTTYSYRKRWSESLIDSDRFKRSGGHENPKTMPFDSELFTASEVKLGGFVLSSGLIADISSWESLRLDTVPAGVAATTTPSTSMAEQSSTGFVAVDGGLYQGSNPGQPQIGDVRVQFSVVMPTDVSVVAQQTGHTFRPYQTKAGRALEMLDLGIVPADAMFEAAQKRNTTLTWVMRLVGFLVMFLGITLVFRPLVVVADVLPVLGNLLGLGVGVFAGFVAAIVSFFVIALAWIAFRPLIGIGLLVVVIVLVVLAVMAARRRKTSRAGAGVPPPPPPPPA